MFRSDNYSQKFQLLKLLKMGKLSVSPLTYFVICSYNFEGKTVGICR